MLTYSIKNEHQPIRMQYKKDRDGFGASLNVEDLPRLFHRQVFAFVLKGVITPR